MTDSNKKWSRTKVSEYDGFSPAPVVFQALLCVVCHFHVFMQLSSPISEYAAL